jgi:hypothetical protein
MKSLGVPRGILNLFLGLDYRILGGAMISLIEREGLLCRGSSRDGSICFGLRLWI